MKQAEQNEIDILLRSFARRNAGTTSHKSGEGFNVKSAHLDADELNAFAEGMLPERARARYTEHLADCADCRSLIIQLRSASTVSVARNEVEKRSTTTFWESITAVFAQPLLRYVLPAVVLASILGIGLLALREKEPEFVAQHQPSAQPQDLNENKQAIPAGSPAQIETVSKDAASPPTRAATVPVEGSTDETADTSRERTDDAVPKSRAEAETPEATPTFAPDVDAPAAPPPLPAYAARDRVGTLSKEDSLKREAQRAQAQEDKLQASNADTGNRQAAAKSAAKPSTEGVQGLMTERRGYEVKDKKGSAADDETRTVAGKRFVRKGGVWVDSAYNASVTTNVKRGSEQYRALVADEPSIRTFADQLGGEVIVVWKGRAYRIR